MRSVIVGLCGDAMQRLTRFASERPWLCGSALLAVATAGLFAWFSGERWDQVDVAAVPKQRLVTAPLAQGSGQTASAELPLGDPVAAMAPDVPRTAAPADQLPSMSDFEDLSTRERITFQTAARPATVDSADTAATAAARGAWLIGTIEEIDDELRHAFGGRAWPGLASHPGAGQW